MFYMSFFVSLLHSWCTYATSVFMFAILQDFVGNMHLSCLWAITINAKFS